MKTIIVATKNHHKIREIKEILSGKDYEIKGLDDYPDYTPPKETGETFMDNAQLKARALKDFLDQRATSDKSRLPAVASAKEGAMIVLADDSGLECEDLHGAPGVHSSRFAGANATDEENNKKLIEMFQDVTHWSRVAQYICAMVLISTDGSETEIEESCQGHIVLVPKGENGFGYDPYFYLEEYSQTMAELSPDEKNKISHRGKALRKLVEELK